MRRPQDGALLTLCWFPPALLTLCCRQQAACAVATNARENTGSSQRTAHRSTHQSGIADHTVECAVSNQRREIITQRNTLGETTQTAEAARRARAHGADPTPRRATASSSRISATRMPRAASSSMTWPTVMVCAGRSPRWGWLHSSHMLDAQLRGRARASVGLRDSRPPGPG